MTERASYPEVYTGGEAPRLFQRVVDMERELMRMKRAEKVLREMEQRSRALMDSAVFLCAVLAPDGRFLAMNRRAEEFFGFQVKNGAGPALQSFMGPGHAKEAESALRDAMKAPVRAAFPILLPYGETRWLDAEYSPTAYQGDDSIQVIAYDITGLLDRPGEDTTAPPPAEAQDEPDEDEQTVPASGLTDITNLTNLTKIPGMFFAADADGRCVEASADFLSAMKLTLGDVEGRLFGEFLAEDGEGDALAEFAAAAREGFFDSLECRVRAGDGEVLSLTLRGRRQGETTLIGCADNTKLRRVEEQLGRVSTTDATTGVLNRQGMERVLDTETERAARYKGSLSMIMLDIDGFRKMNERLGYAASDKALKDLASAVKSGVSLTDFLGRWSGDEFMVLTPAPLTHAANLAEKIRDMAEHMQPAGGGQYTLTLSAGVAEFRKPMDISSFVGAAYDAMIEAKKNGGNLVAQAKGPAAERE